MDIVDRILEAVEKNAFRWGECGCMGPRPGETLCPCRKAAAEAKAKQKDAVIDILVKFALVSAIAEKCRK